MIEGLTTHQVWDLVEHGKAVVVDVREPSQFALGHPPGALSVPYSQKGLNDRLFTIYPPSLPVIVMSASTEQAGEATNQLQNGYFNVLGIITGGMEAWLIDNLPIQAIAEIDAVSINTIVSEKPHAVLDVREPIEWEMGYVPGAILISLGELRDRLDEIPTALPVIVICEAGVRSSSAASMLQAHGLRDVINVADGTAGYRNSNLQLAFYEEVK